jgi:hypothetical protein
MFGAAVPVASVAEDGDLHASENDVGSAAQFGQRSVVNSITKAESMEFATQGDLWRRITTRCVLHSPPC